MSSIQILLLASPDDLMNDHSNVCLPGTRLLLCIFQVFCAFVNPTTSKPSILNSNLSLPFSRGNAQNSILDPLEGVVNSNFIVALCPELRSGLHRATFPAWGLLVSNTQSLSTNSLDCHANASLSKSSIK